MTDTISGDFRLFFFFANYEIKMKFSSKYKTDVVIKEITGFASETVRNYLRKIVLHYMYFLLSRIDFFLGLYYFDSFVGITFTIYIMEN